MQLMSSSVFTHATMSPLTADSFLGTGFVGTPLLAMILDSRSALLMLVGDLAGDLEAASLER